MNKEPNQSEIILYKTEDGSVKIDTVFQNKTIWLTQKKMAELFDVQRPAVTKHLKNIFESGELDEQVVSSILEHTTQHGAVEGKTQTKETKIVFIRSKRNRLCTSLFSVRTGVEQ